MNKTTKTSRERRLHRERLEDYVFSAASHYAAAMALFGLGLALFIISLVFLESSKALGSSLMVLAFTFLFGGGGWANMLKSRLSDYFYDVLNVVAIDEETVRETEAVPMPGTRPIPVTQNGRTELIEMSDRNPLSHEMWTAIAHAVIFDNAPISERSLSKNIHLMSQAQYKKFSEYMRMNRYLTTENGRNKLSERGRRYLSGFISNER